MGQPTAQVEIDKLNASEVSKVLPELKQLLEGAYHNSHMYRDVQQDIKSNPEVFQMFLAKVEKKPVGVAVVESKVHEAFDYMGYAPIHIKRFTVDSNSRGSGIGRKLLDKAKEYAFGELGLEVLFGESNEIGALSMYGREGALYSTEAIREYWRRNTPEQGLAYFAADLSDPIRRGERYPNGQGLRFVFAVSKNIEAQFIRKGYVSKREILKHKLE